MTSEPWTWNEDQLTRFITAARAGDIHTIVEVPPGDDLRTTLQNNDREYEYGWERLLALYVAEDYFQHPMDGVVHDYAEDRYFRYDDDGYLEQHIAIELAVLHSVTRFGIHDPQHAYDRWQAALTGPYPEGTREQLTRIEHLLDDHTRALLAPLTA